MAHFQIKLLTSRLGEINNTTVQLGDSLLKPVNYLETPISEFYNQQEVEESKNNAWDDRIHNYCYSFNEKVSFHTNGQKQLTFSMSRNVWIDSEQTLNPFVSKINTGTQILLIDQYDNEYIFTVTDIKYTLNVSNIIYDYTCQDSFTYQHIRQNSGYTIDNNIESKDFIGAKKLDWWILNKIKKECHISYDYVPLAQGLYIGKDNTLKQYDQFSPLTDVKKIIKPIFSEDQYPDFHEAIPFSISGSNASSSLISLAEEFGLMLNYREHNLRNSDGSRSGLFVRYFWFEPLKNEHTSNLKYSPLINIQSLGFSHGGSSLTTILNVEGGTFEEEIITLLPEIPPFFSTLFASDYWDESIYSEGFFTSICQKKTFLCENGYGSIGDFVYSLDLQTEEDWKASKKHSFYNNEYIYLRLTNSVDDNEVAHFVIPEYYDKIELFDEGKETSFTINNRYYSSKNSKIDFVIYDNKKQEFVVYNNSYSTIPSSMLNSTQDDCYIRVKINTTSNEPAIKNSLVVVKFFRDVTEEELEFARIADSCPWLENKLIDFSYFLSQSIISPAEYKSLLDLLKNKLRITNGKLLYYSSEYYNAIRNKTEILADLTSVLDSLGAAFNSDAVMPYQRTGTISNIKYFEQAYQTFRNAYCKENEQTSIINKSSLLTEYFNKYFKAQQRFLKNLYYFRQYFNQKIQWGANANLAKKTLTLASLEDDDNGSTILTDGTTYEIKRYFSFKEKPTFSIVSSSFDAYDPNTYKPLVKIYQADKTTEVPIIDKTNYTSFYTNLINAGDLERCNNKTGFVSNQLYYKVCYVALKSDQTSWPDSITDTSTSSLWYKFKTDENKIWYASAIPDRQWGIEGKAWPSTITYNGKTLSKDYYCLTYRDIINEYIYNELYNGNLTWVYHQENPYNPVSNWFDDAEIEEVLNLFKPEVFGTTFSQADWNDSSFKNFIHAIKVAGTNIDENQVNDEKVNFYKAHFPVTSVKYTGPAYVEKPCDLTGRTIDYQQVNATGRTVTEYLQYLKDSIIYKKENIKKINSPFESNEYSSYSIPLVTPDNESTYFKRVLTGGSVAGFNAVSLGGLLLGSPVNLGIACLTSWIKSYLIWNSETEWKQSGLNTRNFYDRPFSKSIAFTGYHDENEVVYTKTAASYEEWLVINKHRKQEGAFEIDKIEIVEDEKSDSNWYLYETVNYKNKDYYIYFKKHIDFTDYFNFYSKVGLTYSRIKSLSGSLQRNKTITYADGFLRPIKGSELINKEYKYRILTLTKNNKKTITSDISNLSKLLSLSKNQGRLSKILYYFIYNNTTPLDLSDIENNISWSSCLTGFSFNSNTYVFSNSDSSKQFIVFKEENYNKIKLYNSTDWPSSTIKPAKRFSLYQSQTVYDANDYSIIFDKKEDLVEGFYKYVSGDSGFEKINENTSIIWNNDTEDGGGLTKFFFYDEITESYQRIYSIHQIKKQNNCYYTTNETYEKDCLSTTFDFNLPVYLHQEYYDLVLDNGVLKKQLNTEVEKTFIDSVYYNFHFDDQTKTFSITDSKDREYTRTCELVSINGASLGDISNGHFWYLYHNYIDNPVVFEKAAVIESKLTEYWQQAYAASLYCEYFLPSSWQPQTQGDTNYYNSNIIVLSGDTPILSTRYIPEINLYYRNGNSRLPKYQLEHGDVGNSQFEQDNNSKWVLQGTTKSATVLSTHPTYIAIFATLNEDLNNYTIVNYNNDSEYNKTTYYYVSNPNTGTKWKDFLSEHSSLPSQYDDFSGLYIMAYQTIKRQFKEKPLNNYYACKEEQERTWDSLYKKYPGILLEDSFKNESATTSSELFILAKNYFKDKQEPERGYNIALINAYSNLMSMKNNTWEKYSGQELKIGEGILVDVEEYYNHFDDVYKTLSQYLFITDLSYDLRKDSDIQITVNTIKYQDKLIKRLVKLIK